MLTGIPENAETQKKKRLFTEATPMRVNLDTADLDKALEQKMRLSRPEPFPASRIPCPFSMRED